MNIVKATKMALKSGRGIVNYESRKVGIFLLPTNTEGCYLLMPIDGKAPERERSFAPRWNPKAEDILSKDWELY